ncbi:hypothetical protein [Pseudoxanthomonas winnipegensis]|uniref:hypothetical protein n=1 Tax=Pseudoxanthomonas winnipegensis TaxID=2480810 RepID=UPI003F85DF02
MSSRKLIVGLLSLLPTCGAAAAQNPVPASGWLWGTWVLCEDPDNSPKDSLQFNADGTGLVIRSKGNVEFLHKHSGQSVSLLANANGYAIPIELTSSPGFDKLLAYSDKTGNTASYVKLGSPQARTCSVK